MSPPLEQPIFSLNKGKAFRNQLIHSAMGVGGLNLMSVPLGLASSILLARSLGPVGFGQYAFIISVVTVLSLPLYHGIRQLITREVASFRHEANWNLFRGLLRRTHQLNLLGATLIVLILVAIAVSRASWRIDDRWTLLLLGIVTLPFLGLTGMRCATLQGLGYVVQAQFPDLFVRPAFQLLVVVALLAFGLINPVTAIVSHSTAVIMAFLIASILMHRSWPLESRAAQPNYRNAEWARAWLSFTLLMAANILNNQIGILLLGWIGTNEQVAALRVADRGAQFVSLSLTIVNFVIAPHITSTYLENNKARLQQLSRQSARVALAVALPIALPLILFGDTIIRLVFGSEYVDLTVQPLAILAAAQVINVACGSVGMFLSMTGFERDTLMGQIVALLFNAIAAMFFIPLLGASGAAYAAAIGLITWNVILCIKFMQRLKLRPTAI